MIKRTAGMLHFDRVVIEIRAAVATPSQSERAELLRDLAMAMILFLGKGVFRAFADIELFKRFHIEYGTVVWTDQIDIAPESLYRRVHEHLASTRPV